MTHNIWKRFERTRASNFLALLTMLSLASIRLASGCSCVEIDRSDPTATDRYYDLVFIGVLREVRSDKQTALSKLVGSTNGKILIFDVQRTLKGVESSSQSVVDRSVYDTSCSLQVVPNLSSMVGKSFRVSASRSYTDGSDPDAPAYAITFSLCSSPLLVWPNSKK